MCPLDVNKSALKAEIPIPPEIHPLAIFGVVPFPVVLPGTNGFPTGETHRLLSHVPYMSLAFVLVVKNASTHTAAPLPLSTVERGCASTAALLWCSVLYGGWFLRERRRGRCGGRRRIIPERERLVNARQ